MIADARNFLGTWTGGRLCTPDTFFNAIPRNDIPSCASLAEGAACDDGKPARPAKPRRETKAPATTRRRGLRSSGSRAGPQP